MAGGPAATVHIKGPHSVDRLGHMMVSQDTTSRAWIACSGVESTEVPSNWSLARLKQARDSFEPFRSEHKGPLTGFGSTSNLLWVAGGSTRYPTHR